MGKHRTFMRYLPRGVVFIVLVGLCGCTSLQSSNQAIQRVNPLVGTWVGDVAFSQNGVGNLSATRFIFKDSMVGATLVGERGSYEMNFTYSVNGDRLTLVPVFGGGTGSFGGRQVGNNSPVWNGSGSWNGSRPWGDGTWSPNGSRPFNGSGPSNWTRPENGSQVPGNRRSFMEMSFTYSYDEQHGVLYLDGSPFSKE